MVEWYAEHAKRKEPVEPQQLSYEGLAATDNTSRRVIYHQIMTLSRRRHKNQHLSRMAIEGVFTSVAAINASHPTFIHGVNTPRHLGGDPHASRIRRSTFMD
jgi:hypothetical protein